ncbi:uncharacterized protein HGUI_01721 [Hanseniaspora guilliermondii]|uniref:Co-chaperone HscB C-terminal oligomerisation domain-containing protein n=1 Tax=Hanseniaspora guilliermondii TaxID=56406 RepID=A0A1L0CMA1_9ASCO|nr:uncharacterized protein HGUI_01721 [Hanseniaspora guilliermondii]
MFNKLNRNVILKRSISYDKLFPLTIKSPTNYVINLDKLRKENRQLLLQNRNDSIKTGEINDTYKNLSDDVSRYILYTNTLFNNNIDVGGIDSDPRFNKINDFEFLEEVMDTMEQTDSIRNIEELETMKSNVEESCNDLKTGIERDFENKSFEDSLQKFMKLKYLNNIKNHIDRRIEVVEEMEEN